MIYRKYLKHFIDFVKIDADSLVKLDNSKIKEKVITYVVNLKRRIEGSVKLLTHMLTNSFCKLSDQGLKSQRMIARLFVECASRDQDLQLATILYCLHHTS